MRDPKLDPRAGDVLIRRKGKSQWQERSVREVGPKGVWATECDHADFCRDVTPYLTQWQKWARGAEIVSHAKEGE